MKSCADCGAMFKPNTTQTRCQACRYVADFARRRAIYLVGAAVRSGALTNLRAVAVACVDCGERAEHYDHRDYSAPLAVAPVCRRCNYRRGPARRSAA